MKNPSIILNAPHGDNTKPTKPERHYSKGILMYVYSGYILISIVYDNNKLEVISLDKKQVSCGIHIQWNT